MPGFQCFSNAETWALLKSMEWSFNHACVATLEPFLKAFVFLVWLNDHSIDFKSAHVIDKGNFRVINEGK